jgi:flap endonuclease-1
MGTNIKEIVSKKEIGFEELKGKILVVDSYNIIYQFLSSIRQMDGSPLKDSKGNVTSHLTGLFSRTTRLMAYGLKLAFVFDGKPPELKFGEIERRVALKEEAKKK